MAKLWTLANAEFEISGEYTLIIIAIKIKVAGMPKMKNFSRTVSLND